MNHQLKEDFPTTRLPSPLNCVRFLVLTDGTVYENVLYECGKYKLDGDEIESLMKRATTLMCGSKFWMKKE